MLVPLGIGVSLRLEPAFILAGVPLYYATRKHHSAWARVTRKTNPELDDSLSSRIIGAWGLCIFDRSLADLRWTDRFLASICPTDTRAAACVVWQVTRYGS